MLDYLSIFVVQHPDGSVALGKPDESFSNSSRDRYRMPISPESISPVPPPSLVSFSTNQDTRTNHIGDRCPLSEAALGHINAVKKGIEPMVFSDCNHEQCYETVVDGIEVTHFFYSKIMKKLYYILKYLQRLIHQLSQQENLDEKERFIDSLKAYKSDLIQNEQLKCEKKEYNTIIFNQLHNQSLGNNLKNGIIV